MSGQNTKATADKQDSGITTIECAESVDIRFVEDIQATLIEAIDQGKPTRINAKNVERIDTAGLQLFSSFMNDAQLKGIKVEWDQPSEVVIKAAKLTGLSSVLNLDL